jgi:hypothetical protein
MWYFAYASNMNRRQIEARVQRTQLRWMAARLDGYALQFNKRSTVDQSGKANIVPDGSGVVWGLLFELSEEEFQRLARFEGGYSRQTIEGACIEPPAWFRAETFVAQPDGSGLLPASQYLQLILDGAREHDLPADYQAQLAGPRTSW